MRSWQGKIVTGNIAAREDEYVKGIKYPEGCVSLEFATINCNDLTRSQILAMVEDLTAIAREMRNKQ